MKRLTFAIVALALAGRWAPAEAPSLADAAKKESERREKAKKAGTPQRTLTEDDLATAKGALASTPGGVGVAASPAPASRRGTTTPSPRADAPSEDATRGEEYWRGRAAAARYRLELAQRRLESLQRMIRFG